MSDANDLRSLTDAQLRAGMLFPGNRDDYAKELKRRSTFLVTVVYDSKGISPTPPLKVRFDANDKAKMIDWIRGVKRRGWASKTITITHPDGTSQVISCPRAR